MKHLLLSSLILIASCSTLPRNEDATSRSISALSECKTLLEKFISTNEKKVLSSIEEKMKKYNYTIKDGSLYRNNRKVGNIEVLNAEYLYEWQDYDYHVAWMANGGILKEDMDEIIKAPAQAYGKGFYISLDPFDSDGYGSTLTIFKVNKPMMILQNTDARNISTEKVNELREIGFAGLRGNHKTWLSIINEDYLSQPLVMNDKIAQKLLKDNPDYIEKLQHHGFVKTENDWLRTGIRNIISGKSISNANMRKIIDIYIKTPSTLVKITRDNTLYKKLLSQMTTSDIITAGRKDWYINNSYRELYSEIFKEDKKLYSWSTLFDFVDISRLNLKVSKDKNTLLQMKKFAKNYEENWLASDPTTITNADDFIESLKTLMDVDTTFRNKETFLHSSKNSNNEITLRKQDQFSLQNYRKNLTTIRKSETADTSNFQIKFTGLEQLKTFKSLFTPEEYQNLTSMGETPEALELMLKTLMSKFFDKNNFKKIISISAPNLKKNPSSLFLIFSGLQPFNDPLSNRVAARLYQNWLLKNHFPKEEEIAFCAINELNSVVLDNSSYTSAYWYSAQNWVLKAKNDTELISRAKSIFDQDDELTKELEKSAPYIFLPEVTSLL